MIIQGNGRENCVFKCTFFVEKYIITCKNTWKNKDYNWNYWYINNFYQSKINTDGSTGQFSFF